MNIAIYTRVSTEDQTVEPQLMELRRYAADRSWTIAHQFSDVISGSKRDRSGLDQLMKLVSIKAVDAVLVVKIDRLARSLSHFALLMEQFKKSEVAFVATSQNIDTTNNNPAANLQLNMLAIIAEFEREMIRERTIDGLKAARARGSKLGKPSTKLVANWQEVVTAWKQEGGKNLRDLAWRLGGVSLSTAYNKAKGIK